MKRLIILLSLLGSAPAYAQDFEWASIVECARQQAPDQPPSIPPQTGQPTAAYVRSYVDAQQWDAGQLNIQFCRVAVSAWHEGWRAAHAGKPEDPAP